MNESHILEVHKNNVLIFHMGEVLELWRKAMVSNSHDFNLSNCSVVFEMCETVFGKINVMLLK